MSLATDILKCANSDLSPPSKLTRADYLGLAARHKTKRAAPKGPRVRKPKGKSVVYTAPPHEPVKGVSFRSDVNGWDAYFFDGEKTIRIGLFPTQARAEIARKIYLHWRKRGMQNIPNRPESRLYTRWHASDKS